MDFLPRLIEAIETNVAMNSPIRIGILEPSASAAALRTVSSGVISRYMDGSTLYHTAFQVLIQDADQERAVNVLDSITDYLDSLTQDSIISGNDSFNFITSSVSVLPNFVQKTANDEYVYTAIYAAQIETKGA